MYFNKRTKFLPIVQHWKGLITIFSFKVKQKVHWTGVTFPLINPTNFGKDWWSKSYCWPTHRHFDSDLHRHTIVYCRIATTTVCSLATLYYNWLLSCCCCFCYIIIVSNFYMLFWWFNDLYLIINSLININLFIKWLALSMFYFILFAVT